LSVVVVAVLLLVDHASGFLHVEFQTHLNTHETLEAKEKFELMCHNHGVIPQSYLTDNGSAFTSAGYTSKLREFAQVMRFAGAGAHHHNGISERAIQTTMSVSRTMRLHAAIHWPDVSDPALWPMAVAHAVFLYNHVPNLETGVAPVDLFTRTHWEQRKFHDPQPVLDVVVGAMPQ
jgi:transposase InsO family protein